VSMRLSNFNGVKFTIGPFVFKSIALSYGSKPINNFVAITCTTSVGVLVKLNLVLLRNLVLEGESTVRFGNFVSLHLSKGFFSKT
jgi:hypothetical protein